MSANEAALSNEDRDLLKKAGHAARDLKALALLSTLILVVCAFAILMVPRGRSGADSFEFFFLYVFVFSLVGYVSAYWVLAAAARRGDPLAAGGPAILFFLMIVLVLFSSILFLNNDPEAMGRSVGSLIIPGVIFYCLWRDWNVLKKIDAQGLRETAFPGKTSSRSLCLLGNGLLVASILVFSGGGIFSMDTVFNAKREEMRHAGAFVAILKGEEAAFLKAMKPEDGAFGSDALQNAKGALAALETRISRLEQKSASFSKLHGVVKGYGAAAAEWHKGLDALETAPNAGMKFLEEGDRIRKEAILQFENCYAKKK